MKFNTASEFIDSYLNKVEFITFEDVELPSYEWIRVREYCFDHSSSNPELSAILANIYIYGLGVNSDWTLAKTFCENAAKKGSLNAIFTLGIMHYDGKGFYQSYEKAIPYFEEAANKGLWRAQFKLAVCYTVPRGVRLNHEKAFELYLKVAKRGYPMAQFNAGRYILLEKVQYEKKEECIHWLKLAAEHNIASAMYYLGDAYESGYYVEKNLEIAFSWYERSSISNNLSGHLKLAEYYEKGIFVEQNYQKAYEYYQKAVSNHDGKAKVREYEKNRCHTCGAFFTKTVVKGFFGEKTICSACKKNYYYKF